MIYWLITKKSGSKCLSSFMLNIIVFERRNIMQILDWLRKYHVYLYYFYFTIFIKGFDEIHRSHQCLNYKSCLLFSSSKAILSVWWRENAERNAINCAMNVKRHFLFHSQNQKIKQQKTRLSTEKGNKSVCITRVRLPINT